MIIQYFFEIMMKTPQPVVLPQKEGRKPPLPFAQVQTWSWQASRKTLLYPTTINAALFFCSFWAFSSMLPAFNISCIISLLFFCRIFSGNENTNFSCRFIIPIVSFSLQINCSIDHKNFAIYWPLASSFKSFSHFFSHSMSEQF